MVLYRSPSRRVEPVKYKVYGVRIDESNSDPAAAVTYTDDAEEFIWNYITLPTSRSWIDITHSEDEFVALSTNGRVARSSNGLDWVEESIPVSNASAFRASGIAYGNGMFAVTSTNTTGIATTSDFTKWTMRGIENYGGVGFSGGEIIFDGTRFVALDVSNTQRVCVYSTDGTSWSNGGSTGTAQLSGLVYGEGRYWAAKGTTNFLNGSNPVNWTQTTVSGGSTKYRGAFGNGRFVITSTSGMYSTPTDGTSMVLQSFGNMPKWRAICFTGEEFIAMPDDGTLANFYMVSKDGLNWTLYDTGLKPGTICTAMDHNNGITVAVFNGFIISTTDPTAIDKTFINDIRPCLLGTSMYTGHEVGEVIGYLNPNNYAEFEDGSPANIDGTSDNNGNVMIEIPRMAYLIDREDDDAVVIKVTDHPRAKDLDDRFCYFAHSWETEGDCSRIYIGAYLYMQSRLGDDLINLSLSGRSPVSMSLADAISQAKVNGDHYTLGHTHFELTLLQALYVIRFKTRNGRTVAGAGRAVGTTGVGNTAGMFSSDGTAKIFGIEDFWGIGTSIPYHHRTGFETEGRNTYLAFGKNILNIHDDSWIKIPEQPEIDFVYRYFEKITANNSGGFLPLSGTGSITTNYCSEAAYRNVEGVVRYPSLNSGSVSNLFLAASATNINLACLGRLMYFKEG